ncbi:MAG: UbiX family flavin prenyltransferase [Nitrospinae bacterium]|nr:UbiX family flavin prenyltransferase [Nitrospinota bacterium]
MSDNAVAVSGAPVVIGITGASGVIYGIRLMESLRKCAPEAPIHLVITPAGEKNIGIETGWALEKVRALAHVVHDYHNLAAPVSSGTFKTRGMVVAPCSMRTLSDIAFSRADNLLSRAADVTLKEGRKLILVPRETPLHRGHLELLLKASTLGAVILPPMPGFYSNPQTVDDIVNHTVGKIMDQLGVEHELFKRWGQ